MRHTECTAFKIVRNYWKQKKRRVAKKIKTTNDIIEKSMFLGMDMMLDLIQPYLFNHDRGLCHYNNIIDMADDAIEKYEFLKSPYNKGYIDALKIYTGREQELIGRSKK